MQLRLVGGLFQAVTQRTSSSFCHMPALGPFQVLLGQSAADLKSLSYDPSFSQPAAHLVGQWQMSLSYLHSLA